MLSHCHRQFYSRKAAAATLAVLAVTAGPWRSSFAADEVVTVGRVLEITAKKNAHLLRTSSTARNPLEIHVGDSWYLNHLLEAKNLHALLEICGQPVPLDAGNSKVTKRLSACSDNARPPRTNTGTTGAGVASTLPLAAPSSITAATPSFEIASIGTPSNTANTSSAIAGQVMRGLCIGDAAHCPAWTAGDRVVAEGAVNIGTVEPAEMASAAPASPPAVALNPLSAGAAEVAAALAEAATAGEENAAATGAAVQLEAETATPSATDLAPPTQPAGQQVALAPQTGSAGAVAPAVPEPSATDNNASEFRWPVRGRIISGFGKKPNGQRNDGINLAVPEGTQVKAAEDGIVIYAGNELKSYGNLVLIHHNSGWVSAYANNSKLQVKRGDTVKRGQVIALSGMSGGVTIPQVHFELRKDATPVDPLQHLTEQ